MLTPLAPVNGEAILPLADARAHLNLGADEIETDALIADLREQAIDLVERHSGHALQARQFQWTVDRFAAAMRPPVRPLRSVQSIAYSDPSGADAVLAAPSLRVAGDYLSPAVGLSWPAARYLRGGISVTLTAGFLTAADVPPMLIAAVKLALTAMFEDRASPDLEAAKRAAGMFRRRGV